MAEEMGSGEEKDRFRIDVRKSLQIFSILNKRC